MKIVCDACQAKYSISDDKVQGKVFKIRCKKCSNIIVVRGGAGAAEAAPAPQEKDTRVYDYGYDGAPGGGGGGDDAVWHLVINQDQVGPLTVTEVQQKFASGEVDAETFTWREGFADWLPLAQVDVFAALVASGSTTTASGGGGASAVAAMFGTGGADESGTMRSDPGDLFAAASSGARSSKHEEDDGGDLFGSKPAGAGSAASSASAQKLRGERNENSVLFSLNNLAQLASDSPRPAPSSSSSSAPAGHATGAAGGEGSGLIDIRSMASAYMGASGGGASLGKPATASSIGSIDDLPVFGGGGFSEPAVIVPTARPAANNKMLMIMIAAVGLLAVVAIIMVVLMLSGDKKPDQVAAADTTEKTDDTKKDDSSATAEKVVDSGSAAAPAEAGSAAEAPQEAAKEPEKEPEKAPEATKEKEPAKTSEKHTSSKSSSRSRTTTARAETRTEPKAAPKDTGGCDEVSCVLNNYEGACCAKFRKGGAAKPSGGSKSSNSNLPDGLDRAMISKGIAAVKPRVSSCGDRSSAKGKVKVKVKVGGDGKVDSVSLETSPDPALGACVSAAVKKATFSKTQSGGSFSYPFVF